MPGTLYLVGTPIGNMGDMSERAISTLGEVDFIAAEDTRVSVKLLNRFEIKKPLLCYFEHNRAEMGEKIISRLLGGENCALVTDAGMPAISDPGEELVRNCAALGIPVSVAPGPSAVITALAMSGLPTQRFCFEGFLSTSGKSRREHLEELKKEKRTIVFYEAPHKLKRTLSDFLEYFGDRDIALCRELTKIHEEIIRTTVKKAIELYGDTEPRGEFVLVLRGYEEPEEPEMTIEEALEVLNRYREEGKSLKEASRLAAADTGFRKNDLYDLAVRSTIK
ncbi:MAG: 16S rRNA (cytidine(1402)-2'-O)-methyltransferase [Oscillospiraceae bacterium]|nr:16S rRNA (cytidine(1402)-2'-O)-methyltransferase [Oscillospiraceae bacterium]